MHANELRITVYFKIPKWHSIRRMSNADNVLSLLFSLLLSIRLWHTFASSGRRSYHLSVQHNGIEVKCLQKFASAMNDERINENPPPVQVVTSTGACAGTPFFMQFSFIYLCMFIFTLNGQWNRDILRASAIRHRPSAAHNNLDSWWSWWFANLFAVVVDFFGGIFHFKFSMVFRSVFVCSSVPLQTSSGLRSKIMRNERELYQLIDLVHECIYAEPIQSSREQSKMHSACGFQELSAQEKNKRALANSE